MSLLERFFNQPGYYELVGGPQSGKTTVGLLLALSKRVGDRALWLTTPAEYSPDLTMRIVGEREQGWTCKSVGAFFAFVAGACRDNFIILDSLATLEPDHPESRQIASSIDRHWVKSKCSALVVNQERWPVASGGLRWRSGLVGRFRLVKIRDRPFLLSKLEPTKLWLVWASGSPELRTLTEGERRLWLPKTMYEF